jgi:glycosyltransferase involved in cell wall biosynthesis
MEVSVIVPTRNRSALLTLTLRSVLRQQDVDLEVVVVDEASTDETAAVLGTLRDGRVRVIRHEVARGLPAARNSGAAAAHGKWLAFIDDDDLWAPDKLVSQLRAAWQMNCDWAYTGSVNFMGCRIVHGGPPPNPEQVVTALRRYNAIPGGGSNVIVRRPMWQRVGPFDTRFPNGGEDWDMSIRLAQQGSPAWVCRPLVARRLHSSNMSLDIAGTIRGVRLIESLHRTRVDRGSFHRWIAHSCLRAGRRRMALGHFARAAVQGQLGGVTSDLTAILRARLAAPRRLPEPEETSSADAWTASAAAWLQEYQQLEASEPA